MLWPLIQGSDSALPNAFGRKREQQLKQYTPLETAFASTPHSAPFHLQPPHPDEVFQFPHVCGFDNLHYNALPG